MPFPLASRGAQGYMQDMQHDISSHEHWFADFVDQYRQLELRPGQRDVQGDVLPINLKEEHTAAVLAHTRLLVDEENFPHPLDRACVLAALYHDVARFPQYARWHTFKDSLSVNHGLLGVKVLKRQGRLDSEEPRVRALVLAAVGMHNRFAVPCGLDPDVQLVVDVVRDADKLDIFRIMAGHLAEKPPYNEAVVLHVSQKTDLWSPKVLDDVTHRRVAAYADLTSVSDLRLLLASWMYDLRFAGTRRVLAQSGLIEELLEALPDVSPLSEARAGLLQDLQRLYQRPGGCRAR